MKISGYRAGPGLPNLLIRGSGVAAIASIAGSALAFLMQVALARALGAEGYGVFSVIIAWTAIALIFSKAGFDTAIVKFLPQYVARAEWSNAAGLVSFSRRCVFSFGLIAGIGLAIALFFNRIGNPSASTFAIIVALLPLCSFSEIGAAALRGLRKLAAGIAGDAIVRPSLVILGAVLVLAAGVPLTAGGALALYLLGTVASIVWSSRFISRSELYNANAQPSRDLWRTWLTTAIPLMMANGFLTLLYSVDTVMVGAYRLPLDAGIYSVCTRLAVLILFSMNAAQMAAAPLISHAAADPNPLTLQALIRTFNRYSLLVAVPVTLVLVVFSARILGLFGESFDLGVRTLRILAVMQFLNVLTGPVGTIMSMLGHQRVLALLIAAALVLNILLNVWWIPGYGIVGAAYSALAAHTMWNLTGAWWIRKTLQIDCTVLALAKTRPSEAGQ